MHFLTILWQRVCNTFSCIDETEAPLKLSSEQFYLYKSGEIPLHGHSPIQSFEALSSNCVHLNALRQLAQQ